MHPVGSYTENWLFTEQRVDLLPDRIVTRYARRWGARAERVFPLDDLQEDPDRYWTKDYAWAKLTTVAALVFFTVSNIVLSAWNGFTPVPEWSGHSAALIGVVAALAAIAVAVAFIIAPRVEYTCFMRRAGGDGFWIGERGPNRADYGAFVAAVRDHIGQAAKAA